ncbi:MAG TPA: hypothetical protein P5136_02575 [Methanofastidiosum sp.]|nr:hypothetical protein [Methanofastidiosum sp.]
MRKKDKVTTLKKILKEHKKLDKDWWKLDRLQEKIREKQNKLEDQFRGLAAHYDGVIFSIKNGPDLVTVIYDCDLSMNSRISYTLYYLNSQRGVSDKRYRGWVSPSEIKRSIKEKEFMPTGYKITDKNLPKAVPEKNIIPCSISCIKKEKGKAPIFLFTVENKKKKSKEYFQVKPLSQSALSSGDNQWYLKVITKVDGKHYYKIYKKESNGRFQHSCDAVVKKLKDEEVLGKLMLTF